jgi:hypothetical protein
MDNTWNSRCDEPIEKFDDFKKHGMALSRADF